MHNCHSPASTSQMQHTYKQINSRHCHAKSPVRCSASNTNGHSTNGHNTNGASSSGSFIPIGAAPLPSAQVASRRNGNGSNGHSAKRSSAAATATVILTEQQADMARKGDVLADAVAGAAKTGVPAGQVFVCPEESLFYAQCIEKMVLSRPDCPKSIIEFGAGDGSPVVSALLKSAPCEGRAINAYEISGRAAQLANSKAARYGLADTYAVHNGCFWKGMEETPSECLIANPPYLPAPDDAIMMPSLWGGVDGAGLTRDLLSAGFDSAMLMISAYSNPVLTLQHAQQHGYIVSDFLITPLPFGTYSSEPRVRSWIEGMRGRGEAFYTSNMYFLAGVLFEKCTVVDGSKPDLHNELLKVLTAF